MQDRPTVLELLDAVRGFLERDVVPALDGPRRFHALVAANVLAIVRRELDGEEERLLAEWRRIAPLVDDTRPAPSGLSALRSAVGEATTDLADRIRRGDADTDPVRAAVRRAVRDTVVEKLRVANPRFLAG